MKNVFYSRLSYRYKKKSYPKNLMEISDLQKEFEEARKFWEYIEKRRELLRKHWSGDQWQAEETDDVECLVHNS